MAHKRRKQNQKIKLIGIIASVVVFAGLILAWQLSKGSSDDVSQSEPKTTAQNEISTNQQSANTLAQENQKLNDFLKAWANQRDTKWSIYLEEVSNAVDNSQLRSAGYNADAVMVPASTYKVYVAYAVLHDVENGLYDLNTSTRIGTSVSACLSKMIISSDNECAWALGDLAGWNHINQLVKDKGLTSTNINNYASDGSTLIGDKHSSAADAAKMLKGLHSGDWLNDDHTNLLLGLMKQQIWRERFEAGLPAGTEIAGKPGWLDGVQNEIAIIYGPTNTYILTAYTTEWSANSLATLSEYIYNYFATGSLPTSF